MIYPKKVDMPSKKTKKKKTKKKHKTIQYYFTKFWGIFNTGLLFLQLPP